MANLTENYIETYIVKNYGVLKHNKKAFKKACAKSAKQAKCKAVELFHFIIENKDFNGFCNSYGFNTAYGREIKRDFESNYYNILQEQRQN
tara:strand:+ start:2043 stop:2315 length:273 start_codon:yes stop_codon:yes gene_type:complete